MDARAPAVVAVVVTRDPGPWFDQTLAALKAQDYEELSVLVVVSGGAEDPTARVARVLPEAYVRRLEDDRGFGAAVNETLGMVEGASFFLLCHDDCAPDPDTVHVMVEETYRSNAGVVTPKMVRWEDPSRLLHVGMSADKTGALVDRVQAGEVDHGQHDAVRDVFVAPGGCTLIRADLLTELGGFDAGIVAMGEDLDLSWRVQVAGARVVVAPDARVRHLELVAGGARPVSPEAGPGEPSLQVLQRRHELRAVLKNYGAFHLLRVLPQAAVLALGEIVAALAVRDRVRARAVAGAWRWNFARRKEIRELRRQLKAHRRFADTEVRRLQVRRSARLATYLSRLVHQGYEVAHGLRPGADDVGETIEQPLLTGSVGLAFSEDADFDDLDDLGRRSGRDRHGRRVRRPLFSSRRSRTLVWLVVAVVFLVGTRDLFLPSFPLVGQFAPLLGWSATWAHLASAWQTPGVGTTAPASPAFAVLGAVGTVLFGGMGLTQHLLVLGCIPVGAWGVSRFLKVVASPRARLLGTLAALAVPLPYDALARGRWDGLVAYALVPFLLVRLVRAGGFAPFATDGQATTRWRHSLAGQMVGLGVIEAVAVSFAPAVVVDLFVCAAGVVVGSLVVGAVSHARRVLAVAVGATALAAVLCAPWLVGTFLSGHQALGVFGLASSPSAAPGWSEILRLSLGPVAVSPLGWCLVAAALLPLVIGAGDRLVWAARLWTVALASWVLVLVVARGWTGSFAPVLAVILVPAAVAVAISIGLGVAAFELDLADLHFGWRQVVAAVAVVAASVGYLPVVAAATGGRWGLPAAGYGSSLNFLPQSATPPAFRVLWLGDPSVLPTGGWTVEPGHAYATSESGTPTAVDTFAPAGGVPGATITHAIEELMSGGTSHVGQLLAPLSVGTIVVVAALAPYQAGSQPSVAVAPPSGLVAALSAQDDLQTVPGSDGYVVFQNTVALPERAGRPGGAITAGSSPAAPAWPTGADLYGWTSVLPGPPGARSYAGTVGAGTLYSSYAPAGRWVLVDAGRTVSPKPGFGWAGQFPGTNAGPVTLQFAGTPLVPLTVVASLLVWLAALGVLAARSGPRSFRPRRRRRDRGADEPGPVGPGPDEPGPDGPGPEGPEEVAVAGVGAAAEAS
jgi:GT2 family glycosyltransferase